MELEFKTLYGQLGILAYDPVEDKVECHICGKWFRGLNTHALRTHGLTVDEYREEFGLNRGQSLICEGTRQRLSSLNKELGNWKHLASQTMIKAELIEFLQHIKAKPGYELRQQACLLKSKLLREYNPMNEPETRERALAKSRETWYGSSCQREQSKANIRAAITTIRKRNVENRKWVCSCGATFAIREDLRSHRRNGCIENVSESK